MGVFSVTMKTHERSDLTNDCSDMLNPCAIHGVKPQVFRSVVGRQKYTFFTTLCKHEDCGKIADTKDDLIKFWNKWNPVK